MGWGYGLDSAVRDMAHKPGPFLVTAVALAMMERAGQLPRELQTGF